MADQQKPPYGFELWEVFCWFIELMNICLNQDLQDLRINRIEIVKFHIALLDLRVVMTLCCYTYCAPLERGHWSLGTL